MNLQFTFSFRHVLNSIEKEISPKKPDLSEF